MSYIDFHLFLQAIKVFVHLRYLFKASQNHSLVLFLIGKSLPYIVFHMQASEDLLLIISTGISLNRHHNQVQQNG